MFADNKEESYWLFSNLKSKDLETETTLQHDRCEHWFGLPRGSIILATFIKTDWFWQNLSVQTWISMIPKSRKTIREDCRLRRTLYKNVEVEGIWQWKRDYIFCISTSWVMIPIGNISRPGFQNPNELILLRYHKLNREKTSQRNIACLYLFIL